MKPTQSTHKKENVMNNNVLGRILVVLFFWLLVVPFIVYLAKLIVAIICYAIEKVQEKKEEKARWSAAQKATDSDVEIEGEIIE
jgi:hypothetical protein